MASGLKRFDVVLTRDGSDECVDTFTWGETRDQAYNRVAQMLDHDAITDHVWEGWSFEVAYEPTATVPGVD